jgi:hypothetical protein
MVIGSRFKTKDHSVPIGGTSRRMRGDTTTTPAYRKFGISTITTISNAAHKTSLTDTQSGFRAYNERSMNAIQVTEQGMGASIEIIHKAQLHNLRIVEVPIRVAYGENTSTHNSVYHGVDLLISTLKFVSIDHPLRFYGLPGLCALVLSGFFMVWAFDIYSNEHRLVTNIALLGVGLLIIGIMFFTTAIILYVIINVIREPRRATSSLSGKQ